MDPTNLHRPSVTQKPEPHTMRINTGDSRDGGPGPALLSMTVQLSATDQTCTRVWGSQHVVTARSWQSTGPYFPRHFRGEFLLKCLSPWLSNSLMLSSLQNAEHCSCICLGWLGGPPEPLWKRLWGPVSMICPGVCRC